MRFLWWKDGDLSKEPTNHNMCTHVFEGVSSGACSNYALKRTAKKNEKKYETEGASTLRENFYGDDLLKSLNSEDDAIKLIKNVRSMCNDGGFNLTKFVSNSKKSCTQYLRPLEEIVSKAKTLAVIYQMNKHWAS